MLTSFYSCCIALQSPKASDSTEIGQQAPFESNYRHPETHLRRREGISHMIRLILVRSFILQTFSNLGSQIGDERPISLVRIAPNGEVLATGSWSGSVKLWNIPACTTIRTLRGALYCRSVPSSSLIIMARTQRSSGRRCLAPTGDLIPECGLCQSSQWGW